MAEYTRRLDQMVSVSLVVFVLVVVTAGLYFAFFAQSSADATTQVAGTAQSMESEVLLARNSPAGMGSPNTDEEKQIPGWLILLVTLFILLQVGSIVAAQRVARRVRLENRELRQVTFLCETPMYLGLLGSLLGICVTQWLTGSLAAPLAYLTTITGIILHLFGKFMIVLSLPEVGHGLSLDRTE